MISEYLNKYAIRHHNNQGITVCPVTDITAGVQLAKQLLYYFVDKKTVLYLSGGSLEVLYKDLAIDEKILPGAVGLIDERFGPSMHHKSNEKMIDKTGLLKYFAFRNIPFYPILTTQQRSDGTREEVGREAAATLYDEKIRSLHVTFQKSIGLLGIGPDGHISSIIPNRKDFRNPWFEAHAQHLYVSQFDDQKSQYKERVGMTFLGLSMLDSLLILAFGESKREALDLLFEDGSEEEIPARFFKRPDIAKKTLLITDRTV